MRKVKIAPPERPNGHTLYLHFCLVLERIRVKRLGLDAEEREALASIKLIEDAYEVAKKLKGVRG